MKSNLIACAALALGLASLTAQETANPNSKPVVPPVKRVDPPGTPANPNSTPVNPPFTPSQPSNSGAAPANPSPSTNSNRTNTPPANAQFQGTQIRSPKGEVIGTIAQVIYNPSTGQPDAAVISAGGYLGLNSREVVVPFQLLNRQDLEGEERAYFSLDTNLEKLQAAPRFRPGEEAQFNTSARMNEVYTYWGVQRQNPAAQPNTTNTTPQGGQAVPNGQATPRNPEDPNSTITVPPSGQGTNNRGTSGGSNSNQESSNQGTPNSGGSTSGTSGGPSPSPGK